MQNKRKKIVIADIVFLVTVAVVLAVSMLFSQKIELALGLLYAVDKNSVEVSENDIVVLDRINGGITVSAAEGGGLYVHYVDVGQGDCTIIEFPDGKTMVIDGGENNKKTETAIQAFIDDAFDDSFKYFDYAVLTHPDSDHCGSLDYVLENYPARVVYRPNVEAVGTKANPYTDPGKADLTPNAVTKDTAAYAKSVKAMYQTTAEFTSLVYVTDPDVDTQTITGGTGAEKYSFTFFSPLSDKYTDWNDYSPIMILSYRGFNFALSGDAEKKNEEEFVAKVLAAKTDGVTDKYDIFTDTFTVNAIKCGHHGSRTSTSLGYIEAITTPEGAKNCYYIISCGEGNSYGHPHSETMTKLDGLGVPESNILRTDLLGSITLSVRMDDSGGFAMFYGDKPTVTDPDPEPGEKTEPEYVYVYMELLGIKLKWPVVAWSIYAVLVVLTAVNIVMVISKNDGESGGRGNGRNARNGR